MDAPDDALVLYSGAALAFGTTIRIDVLHGDAGLAAGAIQDALREVQKVDALMSLYQEGSQVYQLNRDGVLLDPDSQLLHVLHFAQELAASSGGSFDITVQPLWQVFSQASARQTLPDADAVLAARARVDWRALAVSPQQVLLSAPGMAITLNGVAQGHAVDLALQALGRHGIGHALLDTGEFGAIGRKSKAKPWQLGIGHPRQHDALLTRLQMDGRAVATSGDYATYFTPDYVHHHIFDPATGYSPPELASATVVAPKGLWADGLSTAFMAMGADKALALAAQWPGVDALLVRKDGVMRSTPGFAKIQA
ncbi:MAG: FAD:protein FMN transferase [Rhodoferax sp.]